MNKLPELDGVSEPERDALMAVLWAEVQRLKTWLEILEAKAYEPHKDAPHSSVPPSHSPKINLPPAPPMRTPREASMGRAGGGRPLPPEPAHVMLAQAKTCSHCGSVVQAHEQHPQAVYDTIEWPLVTSMLSRVEPHGGQCPHDGQLYVAPVPVGREPGTPFGSSFEWLATYWRYSYATSYARLSALLAQVDGVPISEGTLANFCRRVHTRLDPRVEEILRRWRCSRLICCAETSAWVHSRTPWEWVFQHAEVWVPVIRPSRGHGVIPEVLGDHRLTVWVADLFAAVRSVVHPGKRQGPSAYQALQKALSPIASLFEPGGVITVVQCCRTRPLI